MDIRSCLLSLVLIGACLNASPTHAASARCEGCSDEGFKQKAISLGEGSHIISSLSTNVVKHIKVWPNPDGYPIWITKQSAVPSTILENFAGARDLYVASNGTMKAAVSVNGDDLGVQGLAGKSAYDVIRDVNLRGRLGDRLASGTLPGWGNLDRAGEQLIQFGFAAIGVSDASIEIKVVLANGTSVVYKLLPSTQSGDYLEGRARTAAGQVIPEANTAENQGTWYSGSGENLGALIDHLDKIGTSVVFVNSSNIKQISCTWDGRTLTCKVT